MLGNGEVMAGDREATRSGATKRQITPLEEAEISVARGFSERFAFSSHCHRICFLPLPKPENTGNPIVPWGGGHVFLSAGITVRFPQCSAVKF